MNNVESIDIKWAGGMKTTMYMSKDGCTCTVGNYVMVLDSNFAEDIFAVLKKHNIPIGKK